MYNQIYTNDRTTIETIETISMNDRISIERTQTITLIFYKTNLLNPCIRCRLESIPRRDGNLDHDLAIA